MGPGRSLGLLPHGKEGRTHRPRLGRITLSGHPCCCYAAAMLPSIPPPTDCRPPCHHSRQPRLLHLFLCPALHCPACTGTALHSHLSVIDRARQQRSHPVWVMIGCASARDHRLWAANLPTFQPRNLHSGFEVTVTGRWQKPTVAIASVSQAHATSVGRAADLRFTTHRPSTVVLWHTPRLNSNNHH